MPIHKDPTTLIGLGEVAGILNAWYGLEEPFTIDYNTPMVWWNRSRRNKDISLPMPEPAVRIGQRRSPAWEQGIIINWYGEWTDQKVPARARAS